MKRLVLFAVIAAILISCKQDVYYTISSVASPSGSGVIVISPSSGQVLEGTAVTLFASPNGDYVFTGWGGSLSGTENPKTVTVTSDISVVANFTLKTYPLTITVEGEGTVSEKVISTKSEYDSGTVVELTATPSTGWSFDHWEGDLTSTDNPVQITITSAKSVKAVFTKNKYSYNLKIVGPGAVDEYLVPDTRAGFDYGTRILLKAIPTEGAVFKGWSGDILETNETVELVLEKDLNITASFERPIHRYPTPDLLQPSVALKRLYYGIDFSGVAAWGHQFGTFDLNLDGIIDVVNNPTSPDGTKKHDIEIFYGNGDGAYSFISRYPGLIWTRKVFFGDYNNDGYPDIAIAGHGWDYEPFPGESPVILLSNHDSGYEEIVIDDYTSFYHGGTSADFDNDGDLDIFFIDSGDGKSLLLINDGHGSFIRRTDLVNQSLMSSMYNTEMYDIDNDGFIDLLVGAHDHEGPFNWWEKPYQYRNMPIVFWGNGETFNTENFTRLPKTAIDGFGLVTDFDFYDIDNDGIDEIILARTGDGLINKTLVDSYQGRAIQVIKRIGRSFIDITDRVMGIHNSYDVNSGCIWWLDVEEVNEQVLLVARFNQNAKALFRLSNGKLLPYEESPVVKRYITNGFCVYSDSFSQFEDYYDSSYNNDPVAGVGCLKFSGWKQWDGLFFSFNDFMENGADLSHLLEEDYALEFYIKNSDPSLKIDIKIESFLDRESWSMATFFYQYDGQQHPCRDEWEHIIVPLSSFEDWSDHITNYWSKMDHIHFQMSSEGGEDFYLDEIRIRKVLTE